MKKHRQLLFILLFIFSISQVIATNLPSNVNSAFYFSKNDKPLDERVNKLLNSKFGQWLIKRTIKKVEKRKVRLEKKVAKKKAKNGENWQPKQKHNDIGSAIGIVFLLIGFLVGLVGLVTLPIDNLLARQLLAIAGACICAAGSFFVA